MVIFQRDGTKMRVCVCVRLTKRCTQSVPEMYMYNVTLHFHCCIYIVVQICVLSNVLIPPSPYSFSPLPSCPLPPLLPSLPPLPCKQQSRRRTSSPPVFRCDYNVYSTFQSHEPEFDYLKSLEIEEKINQIAWVKPTGASLFLLTTNGRWVWFLTTTIPIVQCLYCDMKWEMQ